MQHSENFFAPLVADYVRKNGQCQWSDLNDYIALNVNLSSEDLSLHDDNSIVYQRTLLNLKSNKSLISEYSNIIHIASGFATIDYAKENNIPEQTSLNSHERKSGRKRVNKKERHLHSVRVFDIWYYQQNNRDSFSDQQQIKIHLNKEKIYQHIVSGKTVEAAVQKVL